MANIMLNETCNLKCPYCFANEFVGKGRSGEMDERTFIKILEFILGDGSESGLGVIGGEPLLHPNFDAFMRRIILDRRVKKTMLYTNGILLDGHWDVCCHAKIHHLVNCNSPEDIGTSNFKRLCNNLHVLLHDKMCTDRVTLGINMYKPNAEYEYIIDLLKKYSLKRLRVSISVPNLDTIRNANAHEYFKLMKPSVLSFFRQLLQIGVIPNYDCNKLPPCMLSAEDKTSLCAGLENGFIAEVEKKSNIFNRFVQCRSVIDIRPDLTAVRCFGLSLWTKCKISNFKNISDLRNYYFRSIDAFANNTSYSPKCSTCYERNVGACNGGCLAFKIKPILSLGMKADAQLPIENET